MRRNGRKIFGAVGVLALSLSLSTGSPAVAQGDGGSKRLEETVAATLMPMTLNDGLLSGPGAEFLAEKARNSQFFLLGEDHGVADIAHMAGAFTPLLKAAGYRYATVEVDPWMGVRMEKALRTGGIQGLETILYPNHPLALPFFNWREEAEAAQRMLTLGSDNVLWGVDQAFIGATTYHLQRIEAEAANPAAKKAAVALAAESNGKLDFLGKVDLARLRSLRDLLTSRADAPLVALADGLIHSATLYQPFVTGTGLSVWESNEQREALIKRNFLDYYRTAAAKDGKPPKVFLKMGATHLSGGISMTGIRAFGGFLDALAVTEGNRSYSVLTLCGPGSKTAQIFGPPGDCTPKFAEMFGELGDHLKNQDFAVIDLKPWKEQPDRWKHLPEVGRDFLWNYDAVIIVSNSAPSTMLRPLDMAPPQ